MFSELSKQQQQKPCCYFCLMAKSFPILHFPINFCINLIVIELKTYFQFLFLFFFFFPHCRSPTHGHHPSLTPSTVCNLFKQTTTTNERNEKKNSECRLHAWGDTLQEAFEQCGVAMFGYMTEIESVELKQCFKITASGDDIESLLFHFLDELLFLFSAEPFLVCGKLEISKFDLVDFEIDCLCYGEPFQLGKHPQGTEVKAITYSAMQVIQRPAKNEVYVIIDI